MEYVESLECEHHSQSGCSCVNLQYFMGVCASVIPTYEFLSVAVSKEQWFHCTAHW